MYSKFFDDIHNELTWIQFSQIPHIAKIPLHEQVQYYNQYLYELSVARNNWLMMQSKGAAPQQQEEEQIIYLYMGGNQG